ncbi:hypothetical protein DFJ58DRAFT_725893 [Suillus subalutaceus]|uniref:uncharacterized protein n=1 Tax=Suillus subalutaceus TaxID=48586 RepID=UPI001B88488F|nr:uncharacterized protein DFJ58DRAFT_725893 [Suillus subalutaceus]KAG1861211.1 hypothetical protein DFJ58DRAFT_725893 [Suillus subalutaceus]
MLFTSLGFKCVIGTLGSRRAVTNHVTEAFHDQMFKNLWEEMLDCTKAASALNVQPCYALDEESKA